MRNASLRTRWVATLAISVAVSYGMGVLSRSSVADFAHTRWLQMVFAVGVALLAAGMLTGYSVAQRTRRRLYDIEEAAVLIAGGRLHHRIVGITGRDEVDQLAIQFNKMGERIETQVALLQQLAEENHRLAESAQRAATIEERQRVARELHDSVSQQLFSLTLIAAAAVQRRADVPEGIADLLVKMEDLARQAQREMRALLLQLRPIDLEGKSLHDAIEGFLQAVADRHGLAVEFHDTSTTSAFAAIEEHLFRIVQEAVANVFKHAKASWVTVELSEFPAFMMLSVTDNGSGISKEATTGGTYGLLAMRERAVRLGGRLDILARDPGTTVRVVIPRSEGAEGDL